MAKYNSAISVTFNDNDGSVGWSARPESISDVARHQRIFGKYRTRWILFKKFWLALMWMEKWAEKDFGESTRYWVFKSEIPE